MTTILLLLAGFLTLVAILFYSFDQVPTKVGFKHMWSMVVNEPIPALAIVLLGTVVIAGFYAQIFGN